MFYEAKENKLKLLHKDNCKTQYFLPVKKEIS